MQKSSRRPRKNTTKGITNVRYVENFASKAINNVKESRANFEKGLPVRCSFNPYMGCEHACTYCYNRFMARFGGYKSLEEINRLIKAKINMPDLLNKEIQKLKQKELIWIGSVVDPYQQAESKYLITRKCLEVLSKNKFPYSVLTKSGLILRDIDILERDKDINEVIITITSDVPKTKEHIEPNSPSTEERLKVVKKLSEMGINVKVFLVPIVPFMTDGPELERLLEKISNTGVNNIYAGVLRLSPLTWSFFSKHISSAQKYKLQELYFKKGESFGGAKVPPAEYRFSLLKRISEVCKNLKTGFFCEDKFYELNNEKETSVDKWKYITPYDIWKFMNKKNLLELSETELLTLARRKVTNPKFEALLRQLSPIRLSDLK